MHFLKQHILSKNCACLKTKLLECLISIWSYGQKYSFYWGIRSQFCHNSFYLQSTAALVAPLQTCPQSLAPLLQVLAVRARARELDCTAHKDRDCKGLGGQQDYGNDDDEGLDAHSVTKSSWGRWCSLCSLHEQLFTSVVSSELDAFSRQSQDLGPWETELLLFFNLKVV